MSENMIEVTEERGVEFYFIPDVGSNKINPNTPEHIFVVNYLNTFINGLGFHSDRIGLNGNVITMATFISQMIIKYELELNTQTEDSSK